MNYYPHHIGDFNSATRHLTRVERSLYRDLIELYYDTEQPLPADNFDRLARRVIAISEDEKEALQFVLDEFFELDGDLYRHERCEREIEKYRNNNSAKAKAGKASAEARKRKAEAAKSNKTTKGQQGLTDAEQPLSECATNQEPVTSNQEPVTSNQVKDITPQAAKPSAPKKSKLDYSSWPELPEDQIFDDWHAMRKRLKAPVNQTVVNNFGRELHSAVAAGFTVNQALSECVTRGWKGLKVEWLQNASARSSPGGGPPAAANVSYTSTDYSRGINPDGSF